MRLLADLIDDADPQQFAELFPVLARHGEAAIGELERELEKVVEPRLDRCARPIRLGGTFRPTIERAIEVAAGMVTERFAFCQDMPYATFRDVVEELGRCGYRPLRIRPYLDGRSLLVAAVWARDGRPWQWLGEADAEQLRSRDAELRREGYVPIDVSVAMLGGRAHRLATRPSGSKQMSTDTEVRLIVGCLGEQEQQAQAALVEEKFNCQIAIAVVRRPRAASWLQPVGPAEGPAEVHHASIPWPCR